MMTSPTHEPPRAADAGARETGVPPSTLILHRSRVVLSPRKYPIHRPSGDQNGPYASLVSALYSPVSRLRTHRCDAVVSTVTTASRRPSGESAWLTP